MNSVDRSPKQRRCILFVIDALSKKILDRWLRSGRLPNMARVIEDGGKMLPCVSIFPSITPAATCSIATGAYPAQNGIEGACWFDPEKNDAAYYGDDVRFALKEGFHDYLVDFGDRLNFERLDAPTIYEYLHEAGIDSACVNYMWFRGPHVHRRRTPTLLKWIAGSLPGKVMGPKYLKLGDFVDDLPAGIGKVTGVKSGLTGRYGFQDQTTAGYMLAMAEQNCLPPFTLAYFPRNDDVGHEEGLESAAEQCLVQFDQFLGKFVEAVGGWEVVSSDYTFLMVGDHSQTEWDSQELKPVYLDQVLSDYRLADATAGLGDDDQLLICPNMRAAAIYVADESCRESVLDKLRGVREINQLIHVEQIEGQPEMITVEAAGRGRLSFRRCDAPDTSAQQTVRDAYGNRWELYGELEVVDLKLDREGNLIDGDYPNALERLEGAMNVKHPPIWLTAGDHAEFALQSVSTHPGGSHGSLDRDDSEAALLCTANVDLSVIPSPSQPRIIDILELCLQSLNAPSSHHSTPAPEPVDEAPVVTSQNAHLAFGFVSSTTKGAR